MPVVGLSYPSYFSYNSSASRFVALDVVASSVLFLGLEFVLKKAHSFCFFLFYVLPYLASGGDRYSSIFVGGNFNKASISYSFTTTGYSSRTAKNLLFTSSFSYGARVGYIAYVDDRVGIRTYLDVQRVLSRDGKGAVSFEFWQPSINTDLVVNFVGAQDKISAGFYVGVGSAINYFSNKVNKVISMAPLVPLNAGFLLFIDSAHVLELGSISPLFLRPFTESASSRSSSMQSVGSYKAAPPISRSVFRNNIVYLGYSYMF